jgi:hypothetical protein
LIFPTQGDRIIFVKKKNMKLKAQDLQTTVNATLEHYNRCAEEFFWAGTRDHDVTEKAATPILWRFSGHSPRARLRPVAS